MSRILAFLSGVTLVTGMELTRIISNPRFTAARKLLWALHLCETIERRRNQIGIS